MCHTPLEPGKSFAEIQSRLLEYLLLSLCSLRMFASLAPNCCERDRIQHGTEWESSSLLQSLLGSPHLAGLLLALANLVPLQPNKLIRQHTTCCTLERGSHSDRFALRAKRRRSLEPSESGKEQS